MSVKSFKFVSPGVFINEIDNSFIPRTPDAIGPVVIGRSSRGLAMQPVKVEAYSDFVEMFGDTVPGFGGGDISRAGNYQSPMYGTYAAKAFLNSGVAPLTYIRLLGQQDASNDGAMDSMAGWQTTRRQITENPETNGGAYALWLFPSGSDTLTDGVLGTGSLGAIFYVEDGTITLSGSIYGGHARTGPVYASPTAVTASTGCVIGNDGNNLFTVVVSGAQAGIENIRFGFDDTSENFIRKKFNTNPQLVSGAYFYAPGSAKSYWLGQSYEQEVRDASLEGNALGIMLAIQSGSTSAFAAGPAYMKNQASVEAKAGWFMSQDLGPPADYVPFNKQRLFRLVGRGHGEWLQRNAKVSIANIRQSTTTTTDYGTFSVIIRSLSDTDSAVQVIERYDQLTLDPTSPDYIARKIGDKYTQWDTVERRLKEYGDYDNQSKFVYVEMNNDVDAGATDATLLPFGYFSPPRFRSIYDVATTGSCATAPGQDPAFGATPGDGSILGKVTFLTGALGIVDHVPGAGSSGLGNAAFLSGGIGSNTGEGASLYGDLSGSFLFPSVRLRHSASDGGFSDPTKAYFGMQTTRTSTSTTYDRSIPDFHTLLYSGYGGGGGTNATAPYTVAGVEDYAYVFSLDNIIKSPSVGNAYYYESGSRVAETAYTSASYTDLLNAGVNKFTAPFFGGFDGFDIKKPDPLYNDGIAAGATNETSYAFYTYKRAIDTVADPESVNMNLLTTPGLTQDTLTGHMINVCEDRADSLALIDLANVYIPAHEVYKSSKVDRIGTTPTTAATALRDRMIDSSYGATFYPWVQTRDENTGALLWIPPSVAMMGVLASSEAASEIWFAPAGFNRGGLTQGAAGIPVSGVTQRLTSKERDTLYESRINPIASFPSNGIVVFGQKTLQERQSALDRINVRRLVIYLKKQISILSTQILFEQNVQATWNRFIALVEPFLANVKIRFGITDYRLILDESTTTPDLIDQNIMYAKIMIKPARAIEYIAIDFVIMSTGASFED